MTAQIRDISEVQVAMLISRTQVIKRVAADAGVQLGDAPYTGSTLDRAWETVVSHPLPDEHDDWIIGSFGGLLIEHFRAQYGFQPKELEDEHGIVLCLVEKRTGAQIFPFDTIFRRLKEQNSGFFSPYLRGIQALLQPHGVLPAVAEA